MLYILSANSLKTLYYSMVHCHLVYGNHIWGCANSSVLTELFRKQKAAVRLISNSCYRAHTEPIFKSLNTLPLPSLIEYFKLQFMQRFVQGHLPPSFNNIHGSQTKLDAAKQYLCLYVIMKNSLYHCLV
jgi:hypothetical protein